jgi:hypothetical protein
MRWVLIAAMFLLFAGTIAMVQAEPHAPGALAEDETPECIDYHAKVRYGAYGYNHFVVIRNGCAQDARCKVSTDVSPEVQRVKVPKGETREVTTFIGSPASEFTPKVACTLE